MGGAIDHQIGVAQHISNACASLLRRHLERALDAAEDALVSRERFAQHEAAALVGQYQVGKGSARVDRDAIGHLRQSSLCANLTALPRVPFRAEAAPASQIPPIRWLSST